MKDVWVSIMASPSRTIYIGVTSDPEGRVWEHRHGAYPGFTKTYGCTRLVHIEEYSNPDDAIALEKELKGWRREKKLALIAEHNPKWFDLSREGDID